MAKREAIKHRRLLYVLLAFTMVLMLFTIFIDLIEAQFQNSAFYFSESVLFSSFWWIFVPLLYLQFIWVRRCKSTKKQLLLLFLPVIVHLVAFPTVVLAVSYLYYYHTFPFVQTFKYGLTTHFISVLMVYTLPISFHIIYNSRTREPAGKPVRNSDPVSSLVVTSRGRRISIATKDIQYFSANSPYTTIHHANKKHLSNETLKAIYSIVDSDMFVQIHKSFIVNIMYVDHYLSRHNGDYDLVLHDGTILRVSRNYARDFKLKFRERHQVIA